MRAKIADYFIEGLTRPLDVIRQHLLSVLGPIARPFIRSRRLRVTTAAVIGFGLAAVFSLWIPLWQLALGPIIWGIPHILGDLRYLIVRQRLARSWGFWLLIVVPLAYFTYKPRVTTTMIALAGAGLLGFIHHIQNRDTSNKPSLIRFASVILIASAGYIIAKAYPYHAHFTLLHAHNLITLGLWWSWRKREHYWELFPILMLIILSAMILFAWDADSWRASHNHVVHGPTHLSMAYFERALASVLPEGWRPQWVALYGFLQSAHYLVWIRLIPEDDREAETPIPFKRSALRLLEDFGGWLILLSLLAMIALVIYAISSVSAARLTYLRWISAHASLEVAIIGYFAIYRPSTSKSS